MKTLIVFGEDWGRHPSSTQHLMTYLANDFNVVWINSIGLRRPQWTLRDLGRLFRKGISMFRRMDADSKPNANSPGFPVISPRVVPLPKTRFARWFNRLLLKQQVRSFCPPNEEIWVWASLPSAIDFKGAFNERRWVYYCGDDFGGLAGVDHKAVLARETQLLDHADWTFAASESLLQRFENYPSSLLPHGVHLKQYAEHESPVQKMKGKRKTLGFYGAIASWIDQPLLIALSRQLKEWDLVLVGPELVNTQALRGEANIHLLPAVAHDQLPGMLQQWDAAILPFIDNDQIRACNPLKLREYLASGTPILSSPFPALQPYSEHVHEITSIERAVDWLRALPEWDTAERRAARRQSVAGESWEARAQMILLRLQQLDFDTSSEINLPASVNCT